MKPYAVLQNCQMNPGAPESTLDTVVSDLTFSVPTDYVDFLRRFDGGEGFIGDNYLVLWRVEELTRFNKELEVQKYAPGLFLFGSDGGGESYGFDTRDGLMAVVQIPYIGMEMRHARAVAATFNEFLQRLAAADLPEDELPGHDDKRE
jgi:cell wall assembly regulator SMI1